MITRASCKRSANHPYGFFFVALLVSLIMCFEVSDIIALAESEIIIFDESDIIILLVSSA